MHALIKRFDSPDETRTFEKGKFEVIKIGHMTIGRASYEPGWKRVMAKQYANQVGPWAEYVPVLRR